MEHHNGGSSGSDGGGGGDGGGDGAAANSAGFVDSFTGSWQDPSVTVSKTAYVAAQLKQLAQAVGSLTASPLAGGGEQGGGGVRGSFTPPFLLPSPSVQIQRQPRVPGSALDTPPGAAPSPSGKNPLTGVPESRPAQQPLDRPSPAGSAPLSGGAKKNRVSPPSSFSPIGSTTTAGSPGGATSRGPAVSVPSPASAGGDGVESEGLWSQQSSVKGFLVSQLEQLSQMLDSPTETARVAMGGSAAAMATNLAAGDGLGTPADQHGAAGRRSGRGSRAGKRTISDASSLQYSLSAISSSSGSSGLFSPSATAPAAAWAAVPGRGEEDGHRAPANNTGDGRVEEGSSANGGKTSVPIAAAAAATTTSITSSVFCSTSREPAAVAAPFEGGGLARAGERKVPLPVVPPPPMTPISGGGNNYRGGRSSGSSRTTGPPSLAGLRPGTTVPSTAAVREDDIEDGGKKEEDEESGDEEEDERNGRQSSSSAAPALSSSSMWRSTRSVREGSAESRLRSRSSVGSRFTEAFGRAKLWRRMLEVESRRESAIMAGIVAENSGVLDQGVVLPCAPSDDEKVQVVRACL